MALAHVRQVGSIWEEQGLLEHLKGTANLADKFANAFGNGDWAKTAGLWHDLGKFNPQWQSYLKSKSGYDPDAHLEGVQGKLDHSTAGALHAGERLGPAGRILAYLIAGHHAGLPDWNHEIGIGGALSKRLEDKTHLEAAKRGEAIERVTEAESPQSRPCIQNPEYCHLWIRMLFSCLVDADFLDTEEFMNPEKSKKRSMYESLESLKARFDEFMAKKEKDAVDSPVNKVRTQVLAACRAGGKLEPGIFSLTVPSGGGKRRNLQ